MTALYIDVAPSARRTSADRADVRVRTNWRYTVPFSPVRLVLPSAEVVSMQHGASGPSIFTLDVLAGFASHEYKLLRQIQLVRSMNGASYYVSDDILDCWGEGESFDAARQDYEANLLEAYVDLADSNEPLSRLAAERLDAIRRFVAPA